MEFEEDKYQTVKIWSCDEYGWSFVGTVQKKRGEVIHLMASDKYITDAEEVRNG